MLLAQFLNSHGPRMLGPVLGHKQPRVVSLSPSPSLTPPLPQVVDVFAMPQSGTGVSVEAVDPVFQTKMLDMLKQCGRYGGSVGGKRGQCGGR